MTDKYIYELPMKVRDYECDLQGIVNNANYQHYLEHTRHEFLLSVAWWRASAWPSRHLCAAAMNSCPSFT